MVKSVNFIIACRAGDDFQEWDGFRGGHDTTDDLTRGYRNPNEVAGQFRPMCESESGNVNQHPAILLTPSD
jgi:hypothetical protein